MKEKLLGIGLGLALAFSSLDVAQGAVASTNVAPSATGISLVAGGLRTSQFLLSCTNAAATGTFVFFDSGSTNLTWTNAAYSNVVLSASALYTNLYTNYFGVINTNIYTNSVYTSITNSVAGATNSYPLMFSIIVPTNSTISVDFPQKWLNGITFTNSGGGNVTVTYSQ